MRRALTISLLFFLPALALAQTTGTGFATQSIFLSQSSVTEGEKVLVYTSIANTSQNKFDGSVVISEDSAKIGSVTVSLNSGEAQVISVPWRPISGSHTITAQLIQNDGTDVGKTSATFTVKAAPKAEPQSNTAVTSETTSVESSTPIQEKIEDVSPAVAKVTLPVLLALDSARISSAQVLDTQLTNTKPKLPGTLFAGTASGNSYKDTALGVFWTFYFYLLTILRYVVDSLVFFYPILVLLFFWLMFKLFRLFSRPKY